MNLYKLNEALIENSPALGFMSKSINLEIDKLSLAEQVECINFFVDGGVLNFRYSHADKTTEKSYTHVELVKGVMKLSVGYLNLPELRKPSRKKRMSGFAALMAMSLENAMKPKESVALNRDNKSMLMYVLPLFKEETMTLELGYGQKAAIPERFNTISKILDEADLEQFMKFKIEV